MLVGREALFPAVATVLPLKVASLTIRFHEAIVDLEEDFEEGYGEVY